MAEFKPEILFGHFLTLKPRKDGDQPFYFQNFYIGTNNVKYGGREYDFVPFGFSGVTVNRSGDNQATQLAFANNGLTRAWSQKVVSTSWLVVIDMVMLDSITTPQATIPQTNLLTSYAGQITGAIWSETELRLEISSVIDAVGSDIPRRRITEDIFGPLPTTSTVRLS